MAQLGDRLSWAIAKANRERRAAGYIQRELTQDLAEARAAREQLAAEAAAEAAARAGAERALHEVGGRLQG